MFTILIGTTFDFVTNVLQSFVFLAVALLYFDGWNVDRSKRTNLIRCIGFVFASVGILLGSAEVLGSVLVSSREVLIILGLGLIFVSIIKEPILHKPNIKKHLAIWPFSLSPFPKIFLPLVALLYFFVGLSYFRRSTQGLDKQLKPAAIAFFVFSFSTVIAVMLTINTQQVFYANLLSEYGLIWYLERILTIIGSLILGGWAWGYVRFRLQTQLFVVFLGSSLIIFTLITTILTAFLLNSLEKERIRHLEIDVKLLEYSLESKENEIITDSQAVANDPTLQEAYKQSDKKRLFSIADAYLARQGTTFLNIASSSGSIIVNTSSEESFGNIPQDDILLSRALEGNSQSRINATQEGTLPAIQIEAASPIFDNKKVTGLAITGFTIDDAFVDGIKSATGLDAAVFAGDTRVASTFIADDKKSRFNGTKESNQSIKDTVFKKGQPFSGFNIIFNKPYYVAYRPLVSINDKIIGMLFVGDEQSNLYAVLTSSAQLAFTGSIILIFISLLPIYLLSKYISEQIEA